MSKLHHFLERDEHDYVYTDGDYVIISSVKLPKETQEENDIKFVGLVADVLNKFYIDKKIMLESKFNDYVKGVYYEKKD